jgi:hypothetical protein
MMIAQISGALPGFITKFLKPMTGWAVAGHVGVGRGQVPCFHATVDELAIMSRPSTEGTPLS